MDVARLLPNAERKLGCAALAARRAQTLAKSVVHQPIACGKAARAEILRNPPSAKRFPTLHAAGARPALPLPSMPRVQTYDRPLSFLTSSRPPKATNSQKKHTQPLAQSRRSQRHHFQRRPHPEGESAPFRVSYAPPAHR